MKKILLILLSFVLIPMQTMAMAVSDTFTIGDEVKVHIEANDNTDQFIVIRNSGADDPYVWMIADSKVYGPKVYDQTGPLHEATNEWDLASIKEDLATLTATWEHAEEKRLLNETDLSIMGITVGTDGRYLIMGNRNFLAPRIFDTPGMDEEEYNYWTMIPGSTSAFVYAVIANTSYNNNTLNPVAYIEQVELSPLNLEDEKLYMIRPVVKVNKQWIDCKVVSEPEKPKQVPTGAVELPMQLFGFAALAGLVYVLVNKKQLFAKI